MENYETVTPKSGLGGLPEEVVYDRVPTMGLRQQRISCFGKVVAYGMWSIIPEVVEHAVSTVST